MSSGSSPRMWGTRKRHSTIKKTPRFIPTHVGNTPHERHTGRESSVHPHACGEHRFSSMRDIVSIGSSPRMWGTRESPFLLQFTGRFIPTHVGNTCILRCSFSYEAVHPHACGEHLTTVGIGFGKDGSSPRMWGTPMAAHTETHARRFIPTHVGNTTQASYMQARSAVHPHACGEHALIKSQSLPATGSSPRMWGTHGNAHVHQPLRRFIPTHVGNTGPVCAVG